MPEQPMEPYYVIMKLPDGKTEEFILMTPFIPAGKNRQNMVAWMCAKSDGTDYGRLVLYDFPAEQSVFGPQQIAARANQDTVISQQLSLWNVEGSSVGTGNLLVIPVESSFLYAVPVYLSSRATRIPEIKRVIVALGDKVAMEPTLNEALAAVVGAPIQPVREMAAAAPAGTPGKPSTAPTPTTTLSTEVQRLVGRAVSQYDKAQEAQRKGDWAEYGRQTEALKQTLEELQNSAAR